MNRQRIISFCGTMIIVFFSTNGLTKSNNLTISPTITNGKIKVTAPSPALPVLVTPTQTKTPAATDGTSKPSTPAVSGKQPKLSPPRVSGTKPNLSAPKTVTMPPSLPPSIGRRGLPDAHIPEDFGKAVNIHKDLGKTNSIDGRLPTGHNTPAAGFGVTGGAAGFAKGFNQRDGIGSVEDEFSDLMKPTLKTGSGAQRQGDETEDIVYGKYTFEGVPSSEIKNFNAALENNISDDNVALLYEEYLTKIDDDSHTGEKDTQPSQPARQKPQSERTADEGPTDAAPDGRYINPNRIKTIFAGSPGIRFVPGEEKGEEGNINPSQLGEIQSNKTQIHTIEGMIPKSSNFEDLSEQAQATIKDKGFSIKSD